MSFFNDTFTDTNGTDLTAHTSDSGHDWLRATASSAGGMDIQSNHTLGASGSWNTLIFYPDVTPPNANYSVFSRLEIVDGSVNSSGSGVGVRVDPTDANINGYFLRVENSIPQRIKLEKFVGGTGTQLGTRNFSYSVNNIFELELVVVGNFITAYVKDVTGGVWLLSTGTSSTRKPLFSVHDSSLTSVGKPGILTHRNFFRYDNFSSAAKQVPSYNKIFGLGSHTVDPDLIYLLKLQETTGTTAVDSSPNGNHGTITGMGSNPTVDTGPNSWLPSCFNFDGSDDYVDLGSALSPDGIDFSLLMFYKLDADPPGSTTPTGFGNFGEALTTTVSNVPWTDGNCYISALRGTGASSVSRINAGNPTPSFTSWRQLCLKTRQVNSTGWQFKLDGTVINQQNGLSSVYMQGPEIIGRSRTSGGTNYFVDGRIAHVAKFSRFISDEEEAQAFAGPEPLYIDDALLEVTGTTSWSGNVGNWDSQNNGTVTCAWELRLVSDDSVVESGTAGSGDSIGDTGTYNDPMYLYISASNDGGTDIAEDQIVPTTIPGVLTGSGTSELDFITEATGSIGFFEESITNTLTFVSDGEFQLILDDRQVPSNVLGLEQVAFAPSHPSGEDFLALTDEAEAILRTTERLEQFLNLTTSAVGYRGVPWLPIEITQTLNLTQTTKNTWFGQASHDLGLVQSVDFSYGLENTLALVGVATGGINYNLLSELELTDSSARGGSMWNRSVSSSLTLQSHSNAYNPNNKCDRRYGSRTGPAASGKLTLRSVDGLHEIELRNPQVDNGRRTAFERILRETRGGSLIVYRDASWPVTQTLQFTIISNKTDKLVALRQFFLDTLGYEIQLIDWLGEEWLGVVIRPDEPFVEDAEGYWTFGFEFEGHKVGGHSGFHNLSLSSEVSFVLE